MDKERYIKCIFTNKTHVPNIVGMSQQNAISSITNAWLTVGNVIEICSDEYPSGYVLTQDPPAGTTVEIGSSVSLTLSSGPCPVSVPDLVGMTTTEAETALAYARLALGNTTEQCNSEFPSGKIVSQSPTAGEQVPPGSKVNIVVSLGPCPVTVPNILWRTRSEAESMITGAGLVVGIVSEQCDDTIPANRIINQYPQAGQQVSAGSTVNFAVSTGPCLVTVPNIVSYKQSIAENILTTAGLVVGEVTQQCHPNIRAGIVISQSPSAGTQVNFGTSVDLVLSIGPCPVEVPDVIAMPQNIAETTITSAGLNLGTITQQCNDSIPAGNVINQFPSPGTQVSPGTAVNLIVSEGLCTEGEGTIEGTSEGEGVIEGITEGTIEGEGVIEGTQEGILEGEGETPPHSADSNGDWKISLSELLRVIQFFNSSGYHCEMGTEDRYAPGYEGDKTCQPHSSDYNPQNWTIELPELLRLIQFFNIGAYHACPDGENGYCPVL